VERPFNSNNVYNTGITNNGTATGVLTFSVPSNAPSTLYYVCEFHSSMGGTINISNLGPTTTQPTTTRPTTQPRTPTPLGPVTLLDGYVITVTNISYNRFTVTFPDATHYKPTLYNGTKSFSSTGINPYTFVGLSGNTEYFIFTRIGNLPYPSYATAKIITPSTPTTKPTTKKPTTKPTTKKPKPRVIAPVQARLLFFAARV
jgi:hypothetical protein